MVPHKLLSHLNTLWPVLIVSELAKRGIDTFFISPGNRNVPIMAAIRALPGTVARFCLDERASAYRALGHAKVSGKPGVLVCTSGTAAANYYPAFIEAFRDEIPMIVWSADRPPELVGSDANQTIDQTGLFGRFALKRLNLPCPSAQYPLRALLARVSDLTRVDNGPVHINLPFREPLLPGSMGGDVAGAGLIETALTFLTAPEPYTSHVEIGRHDRDSRQIASPLKRMAVHSDAGSSVSSEIERLTAILEKCTRGLVVAGRPGSRGDAGPVTEFAEKRKWPVYCDIASGLKGYFTGNNRIPLLDHPAVAALIADYDPEVIIQFGTGLVSKSYYDVVAEGKRKQPTLVQVTTKTGIRDPGHQVDFKFSATAHDAVALFETIRWTRPDEKSKLKLAEGFDALMLKIGQSTPKDVLSHPLIAKILYDRIPEDEAFFAGNSLIVRAFDMMVPDMYKQIDIVTNRGVSGIEGNIATAVGYAESACKRMTLVLGDISFLHDLGSLMLVRHSDVPVIVIVVNNGGGRIFERLPVARFDGIPGEWVTMAHDYGFQKSAEQFGLSYCRVTTPAALKAAYGNVLGDNCSALIEISLSAEDDLRIFETRKAITL